MADTGSGLVTILFTDLVRSTELLSRAGDEEAQRIFRIHHDLLTRVASAHGGREVKWLGDGLMVAFASAVDAVRCALSMQDESRRPIQGERLNIRVGLNAGEALRDEGDYFGLPVVIARRLCDRAEVGQILCTEVVAGLLVGRPGFIFTDLGKLDLKGVPDPVGAREVRYEAESTQTLASRTRFVGRQAELSRLAGRLRDASAGSGGLVVVAGEPGIGKTRLTEELAESARRDGALVVWGRCLEGQWAPPYAPLAEALDGLVSSAEPDQLRADLGPGAAPLAQLVPRIRQVLPDVPEPAPVQPDEESFRLRDAAAQLFAARSRSAPVVLCLDDLQWADKASVAMLRHVARFAPRSRVLILGTFRSAEVGPDHPLSDALAALRREVEYERIDLHGLAVDDVDELIAGFAQHDVSHGFVAAVAEETEGNPFFIRELIAHLVEVGTVYQGPDGRWTSGRPIRELGLPEGVREVIGRRISRLSEAARTFLSVAVAFDGSFRFDVVRSVAELSENEALDAVDDALAAQVLRPGGAPDSYTFAHALIRHTVYDGLSPSRQMRLHRRVAEALEATYGREASPLQAGEIAAQYYRSAGLPGAERGVDFALRAADHADSTGAHDGSARALRMALALLADGDPRRPRLLGRLGITLAWALAFDEAVTVATEAGEAIAATEGAQAAMEYLSHAAHACGMAGSAVHSWALARQGLQHAGLERNVAWALLVSYDHERRSAENPDHPGIPLDTPERRESARILREARLDPFALGPLEAVFESRQEVYASSNLAVRPLFTGESARCIPFFVAEAERARAQGQLARGVRCLAYVGGCSAALGRLEEARSAMADADALAVRLGQPMPIVLMVKDLVAGTIDEGWSELAQAVAPLAVTTNPALSWALGTLRAVAAQIAAHQGETDKALSFLGLLVPWLERAPAWTVNFPMMACHAAETLWLLEAVRHLPVVERAVREKVIRPDFLHIGVDGRHALGRLCALQGRHDEARKWFAEARRVLTEQGAPPLLAVTDYDEALMYARRGRPGDLNLARPLADAARRQFEIIGMTGWIRRADELIAVLH